MRHRGWALVVSMLLFVPGWARAGVKGLIVRERVISGIGDAAPREETRYFSGSKMVRETPKRRTIVDRDAKTITIVRKDRRTYSIVTFDDLRRQSEELRMRYDRLAPGEKPPLTMDAAVSLKPTGKTEKVAGYGAKEYAIEGSGISGSVWATDAFDIGGGAEEWQKVGGDMGGPRGGPGDQFAAAMAKLKGFPLRMTVTFAMGPRPVTTTNEAVEIQEQAPPAEVLSVPQGFEQVSTAGLSL